MLVMLSCLANGSGFGITCTPYKGVRYEFQSFILMCDTDIIKISRKRSWLLYDWV